MRELYDVCVITTIHGDFDKRVYRQICAFADAGLSVCVVAPWDFSKRRRFDYDFVQMDYPKSRFSRLLHTIGTYRAAKKVDAGVYVFHDSDFLPVSVLLKKAASRPVVYDAHENMPENILFGKEWIPAVLRRPLSAAYRRFENHTVSRLGTTIVAVDHLKRRFSALGVDAVLVRNFSRLQRPSNFSNDRAVLYTGSVMRAYGSDILLEISREMVRRGLKTPLRIVDRFLGDEKYRQWFLDETRKGCDNIEMIPSVSAEKMGDVLSLGCIGLCTGIDIPIHALALPTKIFEYYEFGLVVVSIDVEGTRVATDDGRLGVLVPQDDPGAWVDAIERLLTDKAYYDRFRNAALAAAETQFSWKFEAERMVEYVRDLASKSRAANSDRSSPDGEASRSA